MSSREKVPAGFLRAGEGDALPPLPAPGEGEEECDRPLYGCSWYEVGAVSPSPRLEGYGEQLELGLLPLYPCLAGEGVSWGARRGAGLK